MYETNLKQKIRNPLNIRKIESRIYVCDLNNSHNNLDLETTSKLPILTYGGLNTDILADLLSEEGYQVHQDELCPEDDEDIGLRMPDVWYLNKGAGALSIPMYYSFMQLKASVLDGTAFEENKEIVDTFGRVSLIEVYHEKKLFEKLDAEGVKYFSTPRTLTECTRVLEGWDITRVPRLSDYVTFATFIKDWSESNCSTYDSREWDLGEEKTAEIRKLKGTTNVRECVKSFWQNYLLNKMPRVGQDDIEIDIIEPTFISTRSPNIILVGENSFDLSGSPTNLDAPSLSLTSFSKSKTIYLPKKYYDDGKSLATARLASKRFPESDIILIRAPEGAPRVSLMKEDEIKDSVDSNVLLSELVLREFKKKF